MAPFIMSSMIRSVKDLPIKQFFFLLAVLILFIPALLTSVALIKFEFDKNYADTQRYEQEALHILSSAMKQPLYNFDKESDKPLIDHLLIQHKITAIRVYDFEGKLFFEKSIRNSDEKIYTLAHEVLYNGKVIGNVAIDFHEKRFLEYLLEYLPIYGILSFIVLLAISVFYFFINVKILAPVSYLKEQGRRLSENKLETPIRIFNRDELGEMAESFEYMRHSLKLHIEHLEAMVQERTKKLNDLNINLEKRVMEQVEELRKKDHLLVQNAKMAAMGEMIGAIAHQWRQPISVVGMTANNIKIALEMKGELSADELSNYMDTVNEQVRYLSKTIDDFRNFFSPSKEKIRFMPCESTGEIYKLMEAQMKKYNIPLFINEHEHFEVLGYPNEFKQVLLNLFNNIRDAIEERNIKNGKIDVRIENDGTTGTIRVQDNAGGIPEKLLPDKLFEAYVSTKGDKGTGIGLQMCKTIIEKHMGGSLSAHNIDGGAEFVIRLPIYKEGQV